MPACAHNVAPCPFRSSNWLLLAGHSSRTFYINPVQKSQKVSSEGYSTPYRLLPHPPRGQNTSTPGEMLPLEFMCITPRVSDSVSLRWGLRICISNKFPAANAAGLGSYSEKHCARLADLSNYLITLSKKELRLSAEPCAP